MLAIIFSLLFASLQTTQEATSPSDKPTEKQECQISGQVVSQEGGHPLKNAHVLLRPNKAKGTEKPQSQRTGEDGKFCFKNIAPGKYSFGAERRGYVPQKYGAEESWSEGTVLAVEKGQKFEPMLFRLARAGVISGKIVDEDGEAVPGAMVQAMIPPDEAQTMLGEHSGKSAELFKNSFVPVAATATNDLGEYRLAGLPPGKYFVNAVDSGGKMNEMTFIFTGSGALGQDDDSSEEYAPTYYPGTTRAGEAVPIEIKAGDETTASLQLLHEKMVMVSGVVSNEDGTPPAHAFVMLMAAGNPLSMLSSRSYAQAESDGHFSIRHVLPGTYTARAESFDKGEDKGVLMTQQKVEVGQQDVSNLHMVMGKGTTITGKLTVEGGTLPKPSDLNLVLSSEDGFNSSWGEVQKDGNLKVTGVAPGTYKVGVSGLPEHYYIKRVVYGPHASAERELTVESGAQPAKLELVLSPNAATVDGVVQNAKLEPVGGATVTLRTARQKDGESVSTAITDQNGRFELHGLVPGKYVVVARKGKKPASQQGPPETSVTLAESEKKTVTVRIE